MEREKKGKNKGVFIKPELTVEELSYALFCSNKKLEQTNQELIKLQEEQKEMFENLSHDLRSPITAIRNSMDYLFTLDMQEREVSETLSLIYRRVDYLEKLINDIFLLSSMNTASKKLHLETLNIGMFLEDFFFSCEADSKYGKRNLCLCVPEQFPYLVSIDGKLIHRVLDNLFNNALKYTGEIGIIALSAQYTPDNQIMIGVCDNGIGIEEEHLYKIFDRTYMVSSSRTPGENSGTGLGLAIAKSIIEKHKGSIWCESKLGKGSSFFFKLPVVELMAK